MKKEVTWQTVAIIAETVVFVALVFTALKLGYHAGRLRSTIGHPL